MVASLRCATLSRHTDSLLTGHKRPGQTRHVTGAELRIGVVLEAFLDWPLDEVLPWLRRAAPEVTDIESVGACEVRRAAPALRRAA